ncbi:MAG: hypothetical protein RL141_867 [Candidatus Parcubacteria bacterium]|jgi:murein DD-endopeptidase MepM/ murein hydrolase activator NlpD
MRFSRQLLTLGIVTAGVFFAMNAPAAYAQSADVDGLNTEIQQKQSRVRELDALIGNYREKINAGRTEVVTLENQLAILENRIAEKTLSIERTKTEIEALTLEIRLLEAEISTQEARIQKQRDLLASLIREVHRADTVTPLDVLLSQPSLSTFFAHVEEIKRLQGDLGTLLDRVKTVKASLEEQKQQRAQKQERTESERRALQKEQLALEAEHNVKASLLAETANKEQEFSRIVYELNQQQQETAGDIAELEEKIRARLNNVDTALARGDVLMNWPVEPSRGITAIFHDPTYPFRYLFEHPGTDIRASVGTPVKAAAGGYVAWNRLGRMYGNYIMIIHPGGFATVYAHLSKFVALPDTYVDRLETIALSGGRAGDPGAGLSTGPHLHFEVREDGIPVDPEHYLPAIPNDYYDYYDEYKELGVRL